MQKLKLVPLFLLVMAGALSMSFSLSAIAQQLTPTPSGYEDLMGSEIRGLSLDTIETYRTGAGGGIALPAELNGNPGPRHVLDLAVELKLTAEQISSVQALFDEMKPEAIALGEQILVAESELELAFRENTIDEALLETQLSDIGDLQAQLRYVHLRTHIATTRLLTPTQIEQYILLRGYALETPQHGNH